MSLDKTIKLKILKKIIIQKDEMWNLSYYKKLKTHMVNQRTIEKKWIKKIKKRYNSRW